MEQEGFVSLWLGNVQSFEELDRLLTISYSDEGDLIPSIFAKHFEIDRYDDAVREAEYYEEVRRDLNRLLEDFSYYDEIIPKFNALVQEELPNDINAVILLYNFKYTGKIVEAKISSNYLRYIGSVEYQ